MVSRTRFRFGKEPYVVASLGSLYLKDGEATAITYTDTTWDRVENIRLYIPGEDGPEERAFGILTVDKVTQKETTHIVEAIEDCFGWYQIGDQFEAGTYASHPDLHWNIYGLRQEGYANRWGNFYKSAFKIVRAATLVAPNLSGPVGPTGAVGPLGPTVTTSKPSREWIVIQRLASGSLRPSSNPYRHLTRGDAETEALRLAEHGIRKPGDTFVVFETVAQVEPPVPAKAKLTAL